MNKKIKYFFFITILSFLVNCSFDNKTGIWSGDKDEKERIAELERLQKQKINVVKIYTSENVYLKEIPALKNVKLNQPKNNSSWEMSGLNLQNFIGNLYLNGINNLSSFSDGNPLEAKSELEKKLLVLMYWLKKSILFVHSKSNA